MKEISNRSLQQVGFESDCLYRWCTLSSTSNLGLPWILNGIKLAQYVLPLILSHLVLFTNL
ncbi:unnamed protein product [Brassica oleracea]